MSLIFKLDQKIKKQGALVVSCQPVPGSPLDKPEIVAAMALAAEQAGAVALRIEGIANLQATRSQVSVPIIGIIKRDLADSAVRITPYLEDVDALATSGANIIAFDGTLRPRPAEIAALLQRVHDYGLLAMADCSCEQDALFCQQLGVEIIGTTLSGYTTSDTPLEPDLALVQSLTHQGCRVVAEGRYNSPDLARQAIQQGAWMVTVGSAITRLEHICHWYRDALRQGAVV